jgi:uncharacterized protein
MRRLTQADYRRMPWRNGGGTTTEIAIAPEGAGLSGERFVYRISIADVAADGAFSRFDGCDRHIMLVDGAGMRLDCGVHGRIDLDALYEARTFSGDWDVYGTLTDGPVRDFNVIVDRARASASLSSRLVSGRETISVAPYETILVHVLSGALDLAAAGETVIADASLDFTSRSATRIVLARVVTRL